MLAPHDAFLRARVHGAAHWDLQATQHLLTEPPREVTARHLASRYSAAVDAVEFENSW